jgi:hypothetical protein
MTNEEKSTQVRLMSRIYGQAVGVLVHLGEEADGSDFAFDLLQEMSSEQLTDSGEMGKLTRSTLGKKDLRPVAAVMCRPWWRRAWIIQEFVSAKDVLITAGSKEMHWKPFFQAIDNTYSYDELSLNKYRKAFPNFHKGCIALSTLDIGRDKMTTSLLDLFDIFQDKEATRNRDHLFALLPLANDAEDEAFNPDYEEPFESVVRRYAAAFVDRGQVFHLLGTACPNLQSTSKRFPSWIPDWTKKRSYRSPNGVGNAEATYNAAGSTTVKAYYDRPSDQLILNGLQFDRIENIIYSWNSGPENPEDFPLLNGERQISYLQRCEQLIQSVVSYPTGENLQDILWRTLIANRDYSGKTLDERSSDDMKASYFAFRQNLGVSTSADHDKDLHLDDDMFGLAFLSLAQFLTFARTKHGYVCAVPKISKTGDCIFVLQGCAVPFVLRQIGTASERLYHLVGKTYVHGIMDGEVIGSGKYMMKEIYLK